MDAYNIIRERKENKKKKEREEKKEKEKKADEVGGCWNEKALTSTSIVAGGQPSTCTSNHVYLATN